MKTVCGLIILIILFVSFVPLSFMRQVKDDQNIGKSIVFLPPSNSVFPVLDEYWGKGNDYYLFGEDFVAFDPDQSHTPLPLDRSSFVISTRFRVVNYGLERLKLDYWEVYELAPTFTSKRRYFLIPEYLRSRCGRHSDLEIDELRSLSDTSGAGYHYICK